MFLVFTTQIGVLVFYRSFSDSKSIGFIEVFLMEVLFFKRRFVLKMDASGIIVWIFF